MARLLQVLYNCIVNQNEWQKQLDDAIAVICINDNRYY